MNKIKLLKCVQNADFRRAGTCRNTGICPRHVWAHTFFPYSNEIRESHKGRETGWPASISRCHPASVPYLLELPYLIVGGRLSQAHRLVSTGYSRVCSGSFRSPCQLFVSTFVRNQGQRLLVKYLPEVVLPSSSREEDFIQSSIYNKYIPYFLK